MMCSGFLGEVGAVGGPADCSCAVAFNNVGSCVNDVT